MGCIRNGICCQYKTRHLLIYLLFLLISSLTQGSFMAEGRAISKLVEAAKIGSEVKVVVNVRGNLMIGSRPPRCEGIRCRFCGHCEAIQVPVSVHVAHQLHVLLIRGYSTLPLPTMAYSRGDDISNYKPMCWKCKCGDRIFNP